MTDEVQYEDHSLKISGKQVSATILNVRLCTIKAVNLSSILSKLGRGTKEVELRAFHSLVLHARDSIQPENLSDERD